VLVACGVLVIGLASLASVMPAAGYRLAQATIEDRSGVAAAHGMLAYLQKPKEKPAPKAAKKPAATEQLNLF
jgi:hypothetical protein